MQWLNHNTSTGTCQTHQSLWDVNVVNGEDNMVIFDDAVVKMEDEMVKSYHVPRHLPNPPKPYIHNNGYMGKHAKYDYIEATLQCFSI